MGRWSEQREDMHTRSIDVLLHPALTWAGEWVEKALIAGVCPKKWGGRGLGRRHIKVPIAGPTGRKPRLRVPARHGTSHATGPRPGATRSRGLGTAPEEEARHPDRKVGTQTEPRSGSSAGRRTQPRPSHGTQTEPRSGSSGVGA